MVVIRHEEFQRLEHRQNSRLVSHPETRLYPSFGKVQPLSGEGIDNYKRNVKSMPGWTTSRSTVVFFGLSGSGTAAS